MAGELRVLPEGDRVSVLSCSSFSLVLSGSASLGPSFFDFFFFLQCVSLNLDVLL